MRRLVAAALAIVVSACAGEGEKGTRTGTTESAFTSAGAVLVDFDFDATLVADTVDPPAVRRLLNAQLLYLVGQLNGDRSVGKHERAFVSVKTFGPEASSPGAFRFEYRVTIPVAWGGGAIPASYEVVLPARAGAADQATFAQRYSGPCTDPEGGAVDAGRMFLFYRPRRAGCTLAPEDVVRATAQVRRSSANTIGKFPEYHRIWEDGALDLVAIFGHEHDDGRADDAGRLAYDAFVEAARSYTRGATTEALVGPDRSVRIEATVAGAGSVRIDAILVGPVLSQLAPSFDAWYDARSRTADVVLYSGHAGLGTNVRTFAQKGRFVPEKYVVMVINGCDTLAYVDRALTDGRDMDVVTNVLGGWFRTGDETTLHFLRTMVEAARGSPKTYAQLFEGIDPTQIMVVDGEEDNEPPPASPPLDAGSAPPTTQPREPTKSDPADRVRTEPETRAGCSAAPSAPEAGAPAKVTIAIAMLILVMLRQRSRSRWISERSVSGRHGFVNTMSAPASCARWTC